jgi:diacylglycerol kinase family enzyme
MEAARFRHTDGVRVTLIINPFASSVTPRIRVNLTKTLSADHDLDVIETTKGGHAVRLAHRAANDGADVIVALGGDGTINEVANGMLGNTSTAIVPLPGGSTNVFARALGYPNDPIAATSVLVDALAVGSTRPAGVGLANDRAFLFHVGAGFDAAVVGRVENRGPLKRYLGHPLFIASTLFTWFRRIDRSDPWFRIDTDDGRHLVDAQLAIALNCNPYTYLGSRPLDLAPEATLERPLSVVALRSLAVHHLVPAALTALRSDEGVADGGRTSHWADVNRVTLRGHRPFPYQLDGEAMGTTETLTIEHRPDAIRLVVPPAR